MASVSQVLQQKRAELEQEIADFASRKEDEFRSFERRYLHDFPERLKTWSSNADVLCSRINGHLQDPCRSAEKDALPWSNVLERDTQENSEKSALTANGGGSLNQERGMSSLPEQPRLPQALSFSQCHERELEFKGLFTPTYLPLLNAPRRSSSPRVEEAGRVSAEKTAANETQQSTAKFSSSATFPGTHIGSSPSPPHARPFSASVPKQPSHRRRTSSRSDMSISLRSSLRDPNQARSPKRVLFSLDNDVVSPSTSPIMHRSKPDGVAVLPPRMSQPLGSFGPAAVGNFGDNSSDTAQSNTAQVSTSSTNGGTIGYDIHTPLSTRLLGVGDTSPTIGADDFERIDTDDELFTFDEDMNSIEAVVESKHSSEDDWGTDDGERIGEPMAASSPHAGSLPIEIKWPQRLQPR